MSTRKSVTGCLLLWLGLAAHSQAQTFALPAVADTSLRPGTPNLNRGSDPVLKLFAGDGRALLRFDQNAVASAVGSGRLVSASLELFVRSASGWGTDGRPLEAHRLTADWTEEGATWSCALDTQPANSRPDCATQWDGGAFEADSSDTILQTSDEGLRMQLDVTADVAAFLAGTPNRGWLLKKADGEPSGQVEYASREGGVAERPRLVLLVETAVHDEVPPALAITAPNRPILINEPSPAVVVDYADGGSGVDTATLQVLMDGQDVSASCTPGPQSASCHPPALTAGNHMLRARLRDRTGNETQASFDFQLLLGSGPHLVTFQTVGDTYLKKGEANRNQGAESFLRVRETGQSRSLIQFDPQGLATVLSGATLVSASLELHVENNGRNWGPQGRTVGVHRLTAAWTETGATWSCPDDANPSNQTPDCSMPWSGGSFASAPTASVLHTRDLAGWVSFDVISDVAAFAAGTPNHGWLLKKADETRSGLVDYDSRQGTAGEGPRLVVVFETAAGTDTTPPTVAITSPAEGAFVTTPTILVTGSVTDNQEVASVALNGGTVTLTGGEFQAPLALTEGSNSILVTATDAAGNQSSSTRSVVLDFKPPRLTVESPSDGQSTNQAMIRVAGEVADDQALAELTVKGQSVPVIGDRFEVSVSLAPGSDSILVRAVDRAGNETAETVEVSRFTLPNVTMTSPADLSYLAATTVDVEGTVSDLQATVAVNGVPAELSGTSFRAREVPLIEGGNILTATATDANGHVGSATINVVRDLTAPRLAITYPPSGAILTQPAATVSGMVNDIVAGTVNASQATVVVNGRPALVSNRSFLVQGVPLVAGENSLHAVATDVSGNVGEMSITVYFQAPSGPRISIVSGDLQEGVIGTALPAPLVVSLADAAGLPVGGKPVLFKVREGNGTLDGGKRRIAVTTDASGRATAHFTLGTRSGAGSDAVEAIAAGYLGPAVFTATARPGDPALLVVDSGDQQVGTAGQLLPRPLVAVVTDRGFNRLEAFPIKFTVTKGQGHFANGLQEILVSSDSDGRAIAYLVLDPEEGIANNVVEARVEGLDPSPAVGFVASGWTAGDPGMTSISGVVLDNSNVPVAGATLRILDTALTARSDEQGEFRISGAPVGTVKLVVDGSTVERPGSWPDLEFVLTTIPGRENTIRMPIYLLPLDLRNGVAVDETHGGVITLPEIPGFSLEIAPGSVSFPGGSRSGLVSVTTVHNDKVPMVPNFGQQPRFIVTIQPAGARFDPPARLTLPNVEGLSPAEVTEMYSFDHDLGHFVSIGPATVSEDGSVVTSNPGGGILKAGWHCGGNPSTAGAPHDCPGCLICNGNQCVPGCSLPASSQFGQPALLKAGCNCTPTDPCESSPGTCLPGGGCKGVPVQVTGISGPCVAGIGQAASFAAQANDPSKVRWQAPGGSPTTGGPGATFSTAFNQTGQYVVTAGCAASNKTTLIEIAESCSASTPQLIEPPVQVAPVPQGKFGATAHFIPIMNTAPCTDGSQYCHHLISLTQQDLLGVGPAPAGQVDIADANDPKINASNCAQVISDLTPRPPDSGKGPPRQQFWSSRFTDIHENFHLKDWRIRVRLPFLSDVQAFLSSHCQSCPPFPNPLTAQEIKRMYEKRIMEYLDMNGNEKRAYNFDTPEYDQLLASIRARARSQGWPQQCR